MLLNPFQPSVTFHIENSHLFCRASFYMKCNIGLKWVNPFHTTAFFLIRTQPTITCSKLRIETLEQGVKYVQS